MSAVYDKLIQNLNAVKYDLIEIDDPNLSTCIQRIEDAIHYAGRLDLELVKLQVVQEIRRKSVDLDICDCWG